MPLVMMIHGCRETAEEFEQGTRMNAIAAREGFALLYPIRPPSPTSAAAGTGSSPTPPPATANAPSCWR